METWDALRARRNVRNFTDQPVPDEALDRILTESERTTALIEDLMLLAPADAQMDVSGSSPCSFGRRSGRQPRRCTGWWSPPTCL